MQCNFTRVWGDLFLICITVWPVISAGKSFQMTESRLVLVYWIIYLFKYITEMSGQRSIPSITCTFFPYQLLYSIHNLVRSCTTFVAAVSRSKLPGHPALGEFLGELGSMDQGKSTVKGPLGSWYPDTQGEWSTRWVSPQTKMNSIVPWKRRGNQQRKHLWYAGNGRMSKKPTFQRFLSCFWGRPKIPSRKFKHKKTILKSISGRSEKHLTWNPGYFYAGELTTSLYRDHNQRLFLRFLIIDQPCFFMLDITIKRTVCRHCSCDSKASPLQSYRSLAWQ